MAIAWIVWHRSFSTCILASLTLSSSPLIMIFHLEQSSFVSPQFFPAVADSWPFSVSPLSIGTISKSACKRNKTKSSIFRMFELHYCTDLTSPDRMPPRLKASAPVKQTNRKIPEVIFKLQRSHLLRNGVRNQFNYIGWEGRGSVPVCYWIVDFVLPQRQSKYLFPVSFPTNTIHSWFGHGQGLLPESHSSKFRPSSCAGSINSKKGQKEWTSVLARMELRFFRLLPTTTFKQRSPSITISSSTHLISKNLASMQ